MAGGRWQDSLGDNRRGLSALSSSWRRSDTGPCGCGRALVAWVRTHDVANGPRVAVAGACFCDRITVLPTRTRILLLQHPREERVAIGTARMALLALPNSRRRVGLDFSGDPRDVALRDALYAALKARRCRIVPELIAS